MRYIPKTPDDVKLMLKEAGVSSPEDLFKDIPESVRLKRNLNLPKAMSELEIKKHMEFLSEKNAYRHLNFLGAGAYKHFIPALVNPLIFRSEFYTAYTPYQAEMSQGILQALYEYQSMICELTEMDVANASVYEGASALAEACIMAVNIKKKKKILISRASHPEYREVVKTYCHFHGIVLEEMGSDNGSFATEELEKKLTEDVAGVIVQNPNFFGMIENLEEISKIVHKKGALLIVSIVEATSLGILKGPGRFADIVAGEGHVFGNAINFGGPYLGFMAAKMEFVRKLPGRIVGATVDTKGRRGFTLTLSAREQHIRREKASSNICTSQVLNALAASIYLAAMGKKGLREVAQQNLQKANYAFRKIKEAGFETVFDKPFYNEFAVKFDDLKKTNEFLLKNQIIGGLDLGRFYPEYEDCALFCVTELHTKEDIDKLIENLSETN